MNRGDGKKRKRISKEKKKHVDALAYTFFERYRSYIFITGFVGNPSEMVMCSFVSTAG